MTVRQPIVRSESTRADSSLCLGFTKTPLPEVMPGGAVVDVEDGEDVEELWRDADRDVV